MSQARILIIEDEKLIRWTLQQRFRDDGYYVDEAPNGAAGLAILEKTVFDLVMLDYKLPDMTGLDVLRRIREHDPDIVVLMMTAYSSVETAVEAMRGGAHDYITKPVDVSAVLVKREKALENVKMGEVVDGVVRTVVPFGAFIDIGGVEGLVPLSEMSHNRADGPRDVFKVGETVKVKVLRVDEKGKLWLSRKSAVDDPWSQVAQKYAQGTKHTGKIVRLQPFGAFVELESGIDGLIHAADLSLKRIEHPEEVVKVGQELEVVVASVDSRQHRIALHPAPTGEAANEAPQKVQVGKSVKVVVVAIEANGLVVRILGATGRHARGFVSAAATGTPRGTELRKLFPVGKELDVKIVEMDPRRGELKLSIKALNEETERNAYQQYRAQVKREAKFGTLADLLQKRNIVPQK